VCAGGVRAGGVRAEMLCTTALRIKMLRADVL